jgi:hypothetical protein
MSMSARARDAGTGAALPVGLHGRNGNGNGGAPVSAAARPRPREGDDARLALWGRVSLGALLLASLAIVMVAAGQPTWLVPRSNTVFPAWLAGPLHPLAAHVSVTGNLLTYGMSAILVLMAIAYVVVLRCAGALRPRVVVATIVALHAIWLLAPLMPLTDVFNYIGYARLGALHGFNPYQHGIGVALHDPVNLLTTWHNLKTPYGPLFTVTTYALAPLPLPIAYWLLKLLTVAASLGCVALVWRCARQLGRGSLRPALFFAANPLVLVYGLGGFHNDVFMVLPILLGITLLLDRLDGGRTAEGARSAAAGVAFVIATAVKASAAVLLPFGLIAARRRLPFVVAAAVAGVGSIVLSTLVFGFAVPNLGDQSTLLSSFSVPNAFGQLVGLGGAPPWLLVAAKGAVVVTVLWLGVRVWRGQIDWIAASGWATFALILSLSWSLPSYVVWLAPLTALSRSRPLRLATLVLCGYLMLTSLPATSIVLNALHYSPMDSAVGRASNDRARALQH